MRKANGEATDGANRASVFSVTLITANTMNVAPSSVGCDSSNNEIGLRLRVELSLKERGVSEHDPHPSMSQSGAFLLGNARKSSHPAPPKQSSVPGSGIWLYKKIEILVPMHEGRSFLL